MHTIDITIQINNDNYKTLMSLVAETDAFDDPEENDDCTTLVDYIEALIHYATIAKIRFEETENGLIDVTQSSKCDITELRYQ